MTAEAPGDERLGSGVVPSHYQLELAPNLETARFAGRVAIDIVIAAPTAVIVCNAADLDIGRVHLTRSCSPGRSATTRSSGNASQAATTGGAGGGRRLELQAGLDQTSERLSLTDPNSTVFEPGPARLEIEFSGVLNDQLRGFYRSTYSDDGGRIHTIATTQFQATDARRAFPCWDEPAFKASFATTLIVAGGLLAVSNTAETDRRTLADGRQQVSFATTMPMSTYLVAFVVGPLEATPAGEVDGVGLRLIHRPGRRAQTGFALEVARHALGWLSSYYDIPYPSDKLDLVAIPDFAFGAMENLGCVTFREVLLLVDPETASGPELQRIAAVISHELAHMWFGDLVTMAWWEGIWLNEAFATFMETACCDAYRPDWKVWSSFGRGRAAAFETDALGTTRPIEYPVVSPDDAEDMFDILTYQKGASVVRMLEQYLGEEVFRSGVQLYLQRHAYGNTATTDLWDALEEASGEPVRSIMNGWIYQGGHPVVGACPDPHGVTLTQRHFTLRPELADQRTWLVPVGLRTGHGDRETHTRLLLDSNRRILTIAADEVLTANVAAAGFYRVDHDAGSFAAARRPGRLDADERHALVADSWALTLAGALAAPDLLDLLLGFAAERDTTVWQALAEALAALMRLTEPSRATGAPGSADEGSGGEIPAESDDSSASPAAAVLSKIITTLSDPAMADLGIEPGRNREDDRIRELRATLVRLRGAVASDPATIALSRSLQDHHDPTLAAAALGVVAQHGDTDDFARIRLRYETASDPQTELRHLGVLADFGDPALVVTILEATRNGGVRTQDGPYLLRRALANRRVGPTAWSFVTEHWDELNRIFPSNSVARMLEGITALDHPAVAAAAMAFLRDHPVPQGQKQVSQHLERLTVNVALRARDSDRLAAALLARADARSALPRRPSADRRGGL